MNNLHRELAPISEAAWAQIEEETSRTIKRYLAGRRVADVHGPEGAASAAVATGHQRAIEAPGDGGPLNSAKQCPLSRSAFHSILIGRWLTT